jgi:cobaltochelatase CobS
MSQNQPVKFGKIELESGDGTNAYVPANGGNFVDHGDIMKTLAIGIRDNLAVLLMGESGTGKTSAIRYLANLTQHGLRRVNLNGGTTADELVGRLLINEKGTYWVDGVLTEAMRNGEWIVLDEINAALPEVLFVLQSVMDDDGYLVLQEKDDKEVVHKHKDFRLFATCNPPEYAGTKEMNKALLSRFAICINAEFPPAAKELEIIENHLGKAVASTDMAAKLVEMAGKTREAKALGNADYAINTRDILNVLRLVEFMEPMEALSLAFSNKLDTDDNKAVKTTAKLYLPATKKKGMATRTKISTPADIMIGNRYVLDVDTHNAYFGLTNDASAMQNMEKANLGEVIAENSRDTGIKGDEFLVEAVYYEDGATGANKNEITTDGSKAASLITFVAGAKKGSKAILVHHVDLEDTIKVIDHMYEIA